MNEIEMIFAEAKAESRRQENIINHLMYPEADLIVREDVLNYLAELAGHYEEESTSFHLIYKIFRAVKRMEYVNNGKEEA